MIIYCPIPSIQKLLYVIKMFNNDIKRGEKRNYPFSDNNNLEITLLLSWFVCLSRCSLYLLWDASSFEACNHFPFHFIVNNDSSKFHFLGTFISLTLWHNHIILHLTNMRTRKLSLLYLIWEKNNQISCIYKFIG